MEVRDTNAICLTLSHSVIPLKSLEEANSRIDLLPFHGSPPSYGNGGCIVIAIAGLTHLPEGPQNQITVTLNLPRSHVGGQAAFWR